VELLSWLQTIERDFEPPLLQGRKRFNESRGWVGVWLLRSLLGARVEKADTKSRKLVALLSSRWQTWATHVSLAGFTLVPALADLQPAFWQTVAGYGAIGLSFILSLIANLSRMLTLTDPYFNANAYKLFRRQEYDMFQAYFRENRYTFRTIYDWVRLLYKENNLEAVIAEHREIQRQWGEIVEQLQQELNEKELGLERNERIIRELVEQIDSLQRLVKFNEDGFNAAISTIYRLRAGDTLFGTSDLRVLSDFSLFELVGTRLVRICEQGTTETPRMIDIYDPAYAHYSSVRLVHGSNMMETSSSDREGRTISSYWIELPSGRTLIYNFHYNSTSADMHAIIKTKEMYRFIRGICLHLDERGLLQWEGQRHHAAN
jgi:hypothetical protein